MNKRMLTAILLTLALAFSTVAFAEPVHTSYPLSMRVTFSEASGLVYYKAGDGTYTLVDYANNVINTGDYFYMSEDYNMPLFTVARESGLNVRGILNAEGIELVPCQYAKIDMVNADWQIGIFLEETESQDYDYKDSNEEVYYQIAKADCYYKGELAASLTRKQYDDYNDAYGAFLYLSSDESGCGTTVSVKYGIHEYTKNDGYYVHKEYADNGFHYGSGQMAFTSDCALTADEVQQSVKYDNDGNFLDLQGNILSDGGSPYKEFSSIKQYGDYILTRVDNGKYGIADKNGVEIVPAIYDDISNYSDSTTMFHNGYQLATRDNKLVYIAADGTEAFVSDMDIPFDDIKGKLYNPNFACIQSFGKYIVFTPLAGQLEETFDDVNFSYGGWPFMQVKQGDLRGVIDMYGNYVLPLGKAYYDISDDGYTMFSSGYGEDNDHYYNLYHFDPEDVMAQPAKTTIPLASDNSSDTTPTAESEDRWKCSECGAENTGKFCTECGTARPEEETALAEGHWLCPECGTENEGKFCTECGTPRPEEEAALTACPSCGWEIPEGASPKFCPECGTKLVED